MLDAPDRDRPVEVLRWYPGSPRTADLTVLLTGYHLRTEAEKGDAPDGVAGLPERYRREVLDPAAAYAGCTVVLAAVAGRAVACVVLTAPLDGCSEVKRLWVDPTARRRGIAAALLEEVAGAAREAGADTLRLSVWRWRGPAVALYRQAGFEVVPPWGPREGLLCMQRRL
ncbi:acetyltransferase (GNAT) family protein [Kineococcus xinjiangensis]|uniref:Acetyltransferase (GNAT) family protein n=1 Tax=Kineococcus xinjiangensis TaxID=512762 RepID=A0A2S6IKB6_9ACTN|nr:GNAT family N-acetyltransferase [Kineococcus xinjiangensis]PPK94600.1 acetyltransferase (GNAT) family protein [Kineococcus xinjiangensis]